MGKKKRGKIGDLAGEFKRRLARRHFVRWHMSLLLAATVASGVLVDKGLLEAGLGTMGWRYAISVAGAYGVFFLLVRMWIWKVTGIAPRVELDGDGDGLATVAEAGVDWMPELRLGPGMGRAGFSGFQAGDAGGGGASDLFEGSSGSGGMGLPDLEMPDLDDGWWIILILAVFVIVILLCGGYLIWLAPEILPEVALEAAIGAGLVKSLEWREAGWAGRLLKKTWIPLLLVMLAAYGAGYFIQALCPGARTARAAMACAATSVAGEL